MPKPWYLPYEQAEARGARMHVCSYAHCVCNDCQADPDLRRRTVIDRKDGLAKGGAR